MSEFYKDMEMVYKPELERIRKDAARYRWLRSMRWNESVICCVTNPKESVRLGTYCPSDELLDSAIDAAMHAGGI